MTSEHSSRKLSPAYLDPSENEIDDFDLFAGRQSTSQLSCEFFEGEDATCMSEDETDFVFEREIRFNLPKLKVPLRISPEKEAILSEFQLRVFKIGFRVHDRATLAFFSLGLQEWGLDVAVQTFENFVKHATEFDGRNWKEDQTKFDLLQRNFDGGVRQTDGSLWCFHRMDQPSNELGKISFHDEKIIIFHRFAQLMSLIEFEDLTAGINLVRHVDGYSSQIKPDGSQFRSLAVKGVSRFISCWPVKIKARIEVGRSWQKFVALFEYLCKVLAPVLPTKAGNLAILGECRRLTLEEFRKDLPDHIRVPIHLGGDIAIFPRLSTADLVKWKMLL